MSAKEETQKAILLKTCDLAKAESDAFGGSQGECTRVAESTFHVVPSANRSTAEALNSIHGLTTATRLCEVCARAMLEACADDGLKAYFEDDDGTNSYDA